MGIVWEQRAISIQRAGWAAEDSYGTKGSLVVNKLKPVLVCPARETPSDDYHLSNLDQLTYICEMVYCFKPEDRKRSNNALEGIKDGLAKVLVDFYPFAGRLSTGSDERFFVKCTAGGVPFVEAYVEDEIEALGDVTVLDPPKLLKFIHYIPGVYALDQLPLLTVQVTRFNCGGFVIGVAFNHLMIDGPSLAEFMNSWAETARAVPLTLPPFLDRSILKPRQAPKIEFPHPEFVKKENEDLTEQLEYGSICFDPRTLAQLKSLFTCDDSIREVTNFELVTAIMWRNKIKSLNMDPEEEVAIYIFVNIRTRVKGLLPKGFFGNSTVVPCSHCKAGDLVREPLSFAVKLVQEPIRLVTEAYVRSSIDCVEVTKKVMPWKNSTYVSKLSRLALYDADFGWGRPSQMGLATLMYDEVYYISQGKDSDNVVLSLSLPASSMEIFKGLMQSAIESKSPF